MNLLRSHRGALDDYDGTYSINGWFRPRTNEFVPTVASTHTLAAIEEMGYPKGPDYDSNDFEDHELIDRVIADGWVRFSVNGPDMARSDRVGAFYAQTLPAIRAAMQVILPKLNWVPNSIAVETPTQKLGYLDVDQLEQFLKGRVRFPRAPTPEVIPEANREVVRETRTRVEPVYRDPTMRLVEGRDVLGLLMREIEKHARFDDEREGFVTRTPPLGLISFTESPYPNTVEIASVRALERNGGKHILKLVTEIATHHRIGLSLHANAIDPGTDPSDLIRFYQMHGFDSDPNRMRGEEGWNIGEYMWRSPRERTPNLKESFGGYSKGAFWVDPHGNVEEVEQIGDDYDHVEHISPGYREQMAPDYNDDPYADEIEEWRQNRKTEYLVRGWVRAEYTDASWLNLEGDDAWLIQRAAKLLLHPDAKGLIIDQNGKSTEIAAPMIDRYLKKRFRLGPLYREYVKESQLFADDDSGLPNSFWWHDPKQIVPLVGTYHHTEAVVDDPGRFGIDPKWMARRENESDFEYARDNPTVEMAFRQGWVRCNWQGPRRSLYVESNDIKLARACVEALTRRVVVGKALVDITPGPSYEMAHDDVLMFARHGQVPRSAYSS